MNRRTALVAGGVVAAVVTATGTAVPALAAGGAKTVTQHFDAESSGSPLMFTKSAFVSNDNDVASGKTIGRDLLSCTHSGSATHCLVAFAQQGGFLYAEFTSTDSSAVIKGTVNGGTGSFAKATGTLTGQEKSQTDVTITLTYQK